MAYNGSEQSISGITVTGLVSGHSLAADSLTYIAKGTAKGEYAGAFSGAAKIVDGDNNDVTANYAITPVAGKLTIEATDAAVVVTIKENGGTAIYDGQSHTVSGYTIVSISNPLYTASDFKTVDDAVLSISKVDAGTYNMPITAADFENINVNFSNVTFVITDNTLVISKRAVKFTGASDIKTYNGSEQSITGITPDGLANGQSLAASSLTYIAKGTDRKSVV